MSDTLKENATQMAIASIGRVSGDLKLHGFMDLEKVMKSDGSSVESIQGARSGRCPYPFNAHQIDRSIFSNPYHSSCLLTRTSATVGQGFLSDEERKSGPTSLNSSKVHGEQSVESQAKARLINPYYLPSEVDTTLDPLCEYSWNDVLMPVGEDFLKSGNGYIEVSRDKNGAVNALWHLQWAHTQAYFEDPTGKNWHWRFTDSVGGQERRLARWGDRDGMIKRLGLTGSVADNVHEVIHIRKSRGLHRVYGYPEWFPAVPPMELIAAIMQYKQDFFLNRGVPEYALFVTGGRVDPDDWEEISDKLKAQVGAGNSHKSFALNLQSKDIKIQVEKLGVDAKSDTGTFKDKESLEANIVTSWRVPHLLANILIPGKLGASNEFINSLMSFQLLAVGPDQRVFQQTLGRTLGSKDAGLELELQDFILRKLTDLIDINAAQTVAGMREEAPAATSEGRDLSDGLED